MSPNPASDDVQVRFTHPAEKVNFYLLDASGREIRTWLELSGEVHTISVSDLPAGIYHLTAQTADESITKKLVVRRWFTLASSLNILNKGRWIYTAPY